MSLVDAVNQLSDYLNSTIKAGNNTFQATSTRTAAQPDGQLQTQLQTETSTTAMNSIAQNPIANVATDTVNQSITSTAQALVKTVISKVNLTPIENATQQFFSMFATVTSFGTEVAMSFARNTGNNLVTALKQKMATSTSLEAEIVALYNACAILLHGQPFFNQYLQNVANAYGLMVKADANLKSVVAGLEIAVPFYKKNTFTLAMSELNQAEALLLPASNANVSSIRGSTTFIAATVKSQSNQQVYAAAVSMPGITAKIAKLVLTYELQSINVNAYINTYTNALNDYISGYTQSPSINQATIDHINSGLSQLENLIATMNTILSQNPNTTAFKVKLSSYGTVWGAQLAVIIAWLNANPGAGSALLSQTSLSVQAYIKSVAAIQALGNINFTNGEVFINQGEESAFQGLVLPLTALLVTANTLVLTSTAPNDVREQATVVKTYLEKARTNDQKLIEAVSPFLNTKTTLTGSVNSAVQKLVGFANKAGLDRIAGLLTNGKVADLFSSTPDTATYAGAAVVGINDILTTVQQIPNATTQQVSQIQTLRDQVMREQKAQEVYAGRSASITQDADDAQLQANIDNDKTLVTTAQLAAQQVDAEAVADPAAQTQQALVPLVTPGTLPDTPTLQATLTSQ